MTPASRADLMHAAMQAGGIGVWHWDAQADVVYWDRNLEALFGLAPDTFGGTFDHWLELVHPEDREATVKTLEEALDTKAAYVVEHRVLGPDGSVRWVQGRGDVIVGDDGEVLGTTGCTWDVSIQRALAAEREAALADLAEALGRESVGRERLEFVAQLTDVLTGAESAGEVVSRAASAAVPRLGDWCSIVLVDDPASPSFEVAHVDPDMVAFAHELIRRFPYDPDAPYGVAAVVRTGEAEFIPEIDERVLDGMDLEPEMRAIITDRLGLHSSIIVPIRRDGQRFGAMQFVTSANSRTYTDDDVLLAQAIADRIASTLENRRLQDQLRQDEFRAAMDAMLDQVTIVRSERDDDGTIVDFVVEFSNAATRDGAGRGRDELVGRSLIEMYPSIVESGLFAKYVEVVESGVPLVVDRMQYRDLTADGTPIEGWWSLRVVRFRDGYLASSRDDTETVLAEQEMQRAEERDLLTRHALVVLQEAALPRRLPASERVEFGALYRAVEQELPVGGDWYDAFTVPSVGGVGVVIADVAGHGMEAAGVMLQMRHAMRALAFEGAEPDGVLTRANTLLRTMSAELQFVTCCYSLILERAGRLEMHSVLAGHPPPVLGRAGGAVLVGCTPGPPLGVAPDPTYRVERTELRAGDRLLWYTDGLVERRGEALPDSLQRLREVFAAQPGAGPSGEPQAVLDECVGALLGGVERRDDVAAVVGLVRR